MIFTEELGVVSVDTADETSIFFYSVYTTVSNSGSRWRLVFYF